MVLLLLASQIRSSYIAETTRCFVSLPAGLRAAMPVLSLLSGPKIGFFRPAWAYIALTNVKFGTEKRIAGPLHRAKFHVYRDRNVGIQPPKLSKFGILAINLPLGATC